MNNFLYKYERGLSFENVITDIFENREAHKRHKIKYEDSFFEKANSFQITKYFAKFTAYQCFIDFIREEFPEKYSKHENNLNKKAIKAKQELISPIPFKRNINKITVIENNNIKLEKDTNDLIIKWTSGNSKTEFVKLIYALFNAKFINNGKGEITKIVEELAIAFNVELSKSWQSNFSKNKNYTNGGHDQLELFDKIKSAYEEYLKK
ncbi:MAG: RteC domain-containing protein [Bacteroidota bacterium]|nr:RteC domain-containing protein [Bacteroidota bacterium]